MDCSIQNPIKQFIYLKQSHIDPEHYKTVEGNWVDDNGEPIIGMSNLTPESDMGGFLLTVGSSLFYLKKMEKAAEEME